MNSHFDNHNNEQEASEHSTRFNNSSPTTTDQKDPSPTVASLVSESANVENRRPSVVIPSNLDATSLMSPFTPSAEATHTRTHHSHTHTHTHSQSSSMTHQPMLHHHIDRTNGTATPNDMEIDTPISPSSSIPFQMQMQVQHLRSSSSKLSSSSSSSSSSRKQRKTKNKVTKTTSISSLPIYKRFRSRSLPNIWFSSSKHSTMLLNDLKYQQSSAASGNACMKQQQVSSIESSQQQLLLPPVNLQSLHEIDLQEVLKNPQLRHDILFDPQLQFRPNLDGERGKRKRHQAENYWSMIKNEIDLLLISEGNKKVTENSPIALLFHTLKNILLSLIPSKDKTTVEDIMDLKLVVQQLNNQSFDFVSFSDWISSIFKLHCAPMRDPWVDEMNSIFHKVYSTDEETQKSSLNVNMIVDGLRILFSILEAMKLDVANHQIRMLRPALCSTAVGFEKEYFNNAIKKNKINFTLASLLWFKKNSSILNSKNVKQVLDYSILHLLSCSSMVNEFPNTLSFDHTRLVLLRADIRQLICIKICTILYKNLVCQLKLSKEEYLSEEKLVDLKREILQIIIDDNGNSKWTRNLNNLAVHFVNKLAGSLDQSKVKFSFDWLLKQTQPSSPVYKILEKNLFEKILVSLKDNNLDNLHEDSVIDPELKVLTEKLQQLIDFNYSVFGDIYQGFLGDI